MKFLFVLALCTILRLSSGAAVFTYNDTNLWSTLDPTFAACSAGLRQSPIDIVTSSVAKTNNDSIFRLFSEFPPFVSMTLTNSGYTQQLDLTTRHLTIMGSTFNGIRTAQQLHFHMPSEHTIDGTSYPAEVHFVFADVNLANYLALGFLYQISTIPDPMLATIIPFLQNLTGVSTQVSPFTGFDIGQLFYEYEGSLTTPPCTETVHWMVSQKILNATAAQLNALQAMMPMNPSNRPVQPLNGRTVTDNSLRSFCNTADFTCAPTPSPIGITLFKSCVSNNSVDNLLAATCCLQFNPTSPSALLTVNSNFVSNILTGVVNVQVGSAPAVEIPSSNTGSVSGSLATFKGVISVVIPTETNNFPVIATLTTSYQGTTINTMQCYFDYNTLATNNINGDSGFFPLTRNSYSSGYQAPENAIETLAPLRDVILVRFNPEIAYYTVVNVGPDVINKAIKPGTFLSVNLGSCAAQPVVLNTNPNRDTQVDADSPYCYVTESDVSGVVMQQNGAGNRAFPGTNGLTLANTLSFNPMGGLRA